MTDDVFYLMRQECPPPERPQVYAIPRVNVSSAALRSVQPTPAAAPPAGLPEMFVPRGFCWFDEE
jgi:hypothetical protein